MHPIACYAALRVMHNRWNEINNMQPFLFKFGSWYLLIAMLVLAILSIKAYRKSLKKIFILFMIISIPSVSDKIYRKLTLYMLQTHHTSLSQMILKTDTRGESRSAQYRQMQKEKSDLWLKNSDKQKEIEEKYADAISVRKQRTWLKDLWNNIVWRLPSWLFPIGAIIVCLNEIKTSNQ